MSKCPVLWPEAHDETYESDAQLWRLETCLRKLAHECRGLVDASGLEAGGDGGGWESYDPELKELISVLQVAERLLAGPPRKLMEHPMVQAYVRDRDEWKKAYREVCEALGNLLRCEELEFGDESLLPVDHPVIRARELVGGHVR